MLLPNRKYLIHKAVEPEKLTVAGRKTIEDLYRTHFAQYKYDGCNMFAIIRQRNAEEGGGFAVYKFSRTGEEVLSMDHIDADLIETFKGYAIAHSAFVVFGEAWEPERTQQQISGDFRRHSPSPGLQFVVFDMMTYHEFCQGTSINKYGDRYRALAYTLTATGNRFPLAATFNPGSYGNGAELRDSLLARHPIGYDGLIYRADDYWVAGSGTAGGIIKDKVDLSFDLLVLGVNEGTRANKDKVGSLTLQFKDGTTVEVGTGLSKVQREAWWANPDLIVGKIVHVEALGFTGDGRSLREPRLKGIRFDKEQPDY